METVDLPHASFVFTRISKYFLGSTESETGEESENSETKKHTARERDNGTLNNLSGKVARALRLAGKIINSFAESGRSSLLDGRRYKLFHRRDIGVPGDGLHSDARPTKRAYDGRLNGTAIREENSGSVICRQTVPLALSSGAVCP